MLIQNYSYLGKSPRRGGFDKFVMDGMHLPTKDGEVTLTTAGTGGRPMEAWAEFLGEPRLLDPKFATRASRNDNWEALYNLVAPKLKQWNNLDLMRETMARGLVIGLVQSPKQVVESPHLDARGYFVELPHPDAGTLRYPGPGFMLDGVNPMQTTRAAPRLGEHNEEILGKLR
jgi:crotonobetainyl-CoA:carnitine CoA-transferase CaiB-like acyl-CoA transferase